MIKQMNNICKTFGERLGIFITLPDPGRKTLYAAMIGNFTLGAGLIAAGIIFSSKWCAALGGISMLNGVVLRQEGRNNK